MFLVNVRAMHALPRVFRCGTNAVQIELDFIKFTNDLLCVMSVLKSPHSRIGVSVSGFMFRNTTLMASL